MVSPFAVVTDKNHPTPTASLVLLRKFPANLSQLDQSHFCLIDWSLPAKSFNKIEETYAMSSIGRGV